MPEIRPFRALRYNPERFGPDLSALIAPPYDVLDAKDKAALLAQDEHNIVAVDLPFLPPKSAGPDEVYAQAARRLNQWLHDGIMTREARPAVYVYHQHYEHAGRAYTRKMFFARMRLEEFGAGTVFPHERTFGGPKEDRLKLIQATRCQLSAVFGLYSDSGRAVSGLLDVGDLEPVATARMQGVTNRLWRVSNVESIEKLRDALAGKPVYIADGHHRYGTALTYRKLLSDQGPLPPDHPADFVLVGFCAMEDPGCVILPTHRVVSGWRGVGASRVLDALRTGVDLRMADAQDADPETWLPAGSSDDVAVYVAGLRQRYRGRFTRREVLDELAAERKPAYRRLDLAYLHDYLLDELIARGLLGGTAPAVSYTHSADEAVRLAEDCGGIAFITRPCTMQQLREVSEAGELMPQKSTFFYPKLATGLVINPLDD